MHSVQPRPSWHDSGTPVKSIHALFTNVQAPSGADIQSIVGIASAMTTNGTDAAGRDETGDRISAK
jgi:hypothetical protein